MPQGKLDRPAVPAGVAQLAERVRGAAARTDARVTAGAIQVRFRPGAGDAVSPYAPGPRPPVRANALLAIPLRRSDARRDPQLVQLSRRPGDAWRPQLTADQLRGDRVIRRTVVGKSRPLSYVSRFLGRVGIGGDPSAAAAEGSTEARDPLPCVDCG